MTGHEPAPLLPGEIARRDEWGLRLRSQPVRLTWTLANLPARDGHTVDLHVSAGLRPVDRPADREMLAEHFLASVESISGEALRTHFSAPLETAARATVLNRDARDALSADDLAGVLAAAAERVAFACGLEFVPPLTVAARSVSLESAAAHAQAEARATARLASQHDRLRRASALLNDFRSARAAAPDDSTDALIARLAPGGEADLWQTLLKADAADLSRNVAQHRLALACGDAVVHFDPASSDAPAITRLPDTLGPLRCVRAATVNGQSRWLVGARGGVWSIDPANVHDAQPLHAQPADSPLGFNAVAVDTARQQIVATHSAVGLVSWPLAGSATSTWRTKQEDGFRLLVETGGRLYAARGNGVVAFDGDAAHDVRFQADADPIQTEVSVDGPPAASSNQADVVGLIPCAGGLIVVRADGIIERVINDRVVETHARHEPIAAAGVVTLLGENRLLLAGPAGAVKCVGIGGAGVIEFRSAHQAPRGLAGCGAHVAALSADRHRLIVWPAWDGAAPREINLFALTGHRAADVATVAWPRR